MKDITDLSAGVIGADPSLFKNIKEKYTTSILPADASKNYIDSYASSNAEDVCTYNESTITFEESGTYYLALVANGANSNVTKNPIIYAKKFTLQEVETDEPEEPTNNSVVYAFNYDSLKKAIEGFDTTPNSYSLNAGVGGVGWAFHAKRNFSTNSIYETFLKLSSSSNAGTSVAPSSAVFAIDVDKAGTYIPSINYQKLRRGGHLKVYLTKTYSGIDDIYSNFTPLDNTYVNTYSYNNNVASGEDGSHAYKSVTLEKGTYYLALTIDGTDSTFDDDPQIHIYNFTLTPVEGAPSNSVSYCETSNLPDAAMKIRSLTRGASVTVSAAEVDGYTFRAWVRGSADNGTWVSSDAEYTFSPMTHTMLTAVYTENPTEDEKVVEYYNENGEYITTKDVTEESPVPTKLVGYEFDDWYVGDGIKLALDTITETLTRAVAKHNVEDSEYTVSYNGNETYKYDEPVTLTSAEAVCWLRDGKPVDYGTTYTFYVWDDTRVTTSSGDNSPKVMLDTPKGNSRMIEYDAGNGNIVEAGIIFGDISSITVESCSEKMISQRLSNHGQFTATSDCSYARGYIIYKNINGGLEIIYAD